MKQDRKAGMPENFLDLYRLTENKNNKVALKKSTQNS